MMNDFQRSGQCNLALAKINFAGGVAGAWGISKYNAMKEKLNYGCHYLELKT